MPNQGAILENDRYALSAAVSGADSVAVVLGFGRFRKLTHLIPAAVIWGLPAC